jgi:hypothetical protein
VLDEMQETGYLGTELVHTHAAFSGMVR